MRQVVHLFPLIFLFLISFSVTLAVMIHRDFNWRLSWQVTELKPDWLVEIAPHYYQLKDVEDCKFSYSPLRLQVF